MRLVDRWVWVLMVAYVLFQAFGDFLNQAPEIETTQAGEVIRLPRGLPTVSLEGHGRREHGVYIGTAFAVGSGDDWITARHVTEGCNALRLERYEDGEFGKAVPVSGNVLHQGADIARIDAEHPRTGSLAVLGVDDGRMPVKAWGHGFPQAQSAWVDVRFLSEIAVHDRRSGTAYGAVWHVDRYPDLPVALDLGGLSGGPLIDQYGRVRGIVVGSDPRRARLVTIDPFYGQSLSDAKIGAAVAGFDALAPWERDQVLKDSGLVRLVNCRS